MISQNKRLFAFGAWLVLWPYAAGLLEVERTPELVIGAIVGVALAVWTYGVPIGEE